MGFGGIDSRWSVAVFCDIQLVRYHAKVIDVAARSIAALVIY